MRRHIIYLATLSLLILRLPAEAQIQDPFVALKAGFARGFEDPGRKGISDFTFIEEELKGDEKDQLEPAYDPYLDHVPLKAYEHRPIEELRGSLGDSFRAGEDPYANEYKTKDPLTRFPELKYRDERYWMLDNYRATHLIGEKGQILVDGSERSKNEVEIRWTSALIDLDKVKNVYWVMTTFNTKVGPVRIKTGHAQLYFEFDRGGVQTPLGYFDSLVNSYEGFRDEGTIFNPVKGMLGQYDSIFVMGSFEDVTLKALMVFNGVDIYKLDLDRSAIRKLLVNSLAQATDRDELAKKKYNTTRNSCVTNQVRLINSALPEDQHISEWHTILGYRVFRTLGSILPSQLPNTLRKYKLILTEEHHIGRDNISRLYRQTRAQLDSKQAQTHKFELLYEVTGE